MQEEAESKFRLLEKMARESRFVASLAHLPHSKVDWSVSTEAMAAGGVCWIPEAGCEAANKAPSPPPPEPRFVMFRTMNIVFLDPPGVVAAR